MSEARLIIPAGTLRKRAWSLRCPACGVGKPFMGWFRLHERCPHCGYGFSRESGYFLGSIYLNYGLTGFVILLWIGLSFFAFDAALWVQTILPLIFAILFPLWFLRYARALWMALDLSLDPARAEEFKKDSSGLAASASQDLDAQGQAHTKKANQESGPEL